MKPEILDTPRGPAWGLEFDLADIQAWRATVAQVRDCVLAGLVSGGHFHKGPGSETAPSQQEVEDLAESAMGAVRAGRLIDFGMLPNEAIKAGGKRGGALYTLGGLRHPFDEPWMFLHGLDGDVHRNGMAPSCIYIVHPLEPERPGGDCEVVELEAISVFGTNHLLIGDRALLTPDPDDPHQISRSAERYGAHVIPASWRTLQAAMEKKTFAEIERAAAGNVIDPLMIALLMLNTTGVERETVRASEKLQRARAKSGKRPIPPYQRMTETELYVTALTAGGKRRARGEDQGGTHASPVPHLRMGHPRTYANGQTTFIRETLVRVSPEARAAFQSSRSHYTVEKRP